MDLITIVNIAEIFGAIVVVSGVVFGIIQIRQYQQQRQEVAAVQLVNSFQNPEFNKALRKVWSLPDNATIKELRQQGEEWEEAAYLCGTVVRFRTDRGACGQLLRRRVDAPGYGIGWLDV